MDILRFNLLGISLVIKGDGVAMDGDLMYIEITNVVVLNSFNEFRANERILFRCHAF